MTGSSEQGPGPWVEEARPYLVRDSGALHLATDEDSALILGLVGELLCQARAAGSELLLSITLSPARKEIIISMERR